jgi:putative colanic acid biosynthesis glycosyltransferase
MFSMNPTVSVITVSYNTAASLEQTIESVLNQQDVTVEYILIDGGSTDGTSEILDRYRQRLAHCISEPDLGVYDAMNKGMALATGDWLFFIGADDQLTDEHTFSQVWGHLAAQQIHWQELDLVFGDVRYLDGLQLVRLYCSRFDASLFIKNRLHHQGAFYRRNYLANWRYDRSFRAFADYELNLKMYLMKSRSAKVPTVIADCQVGGLSGRVLWSGWQEEMAIRHRHLGPWLSFPWDILGVVRYGLKHLRKFSMGFGAL